MSPSNELHGMTQRRLVVVRHAKTEPYAATDHERALTAPGRRAAHSVGRRLKDAGLIPDYALISSAVRAQQTWAAISEDWGTDVHVESSDRLYHAAPDDVIETVRWVPVAAHTVIYVGHNPTAGELPHLLDDGTGDRAALADIATGYPTSAVAVFEIETAWADLSIGGAKLVDFFVGDRD